MKREDLLSTLDLIEEHARITRDEFPDRLNKERQRQILALVQDLRRLATQPELPPVADPEAAVKLSVP